MRNRINEFKTLLRTDSFVSSYIVAIGIAILVDWLLIPYFTKSMGLYVPLTLISIYYIVTELSGYIDPLFSKISLSKMFGLLIVLDTIQFIILFSYFIDKELFTYLLMVILSIQALMYEVYSVRMITFLEIYKSNVKISTLQGLVLFNKTNMVFVGLTITAIYSLIVKEFDYMIMFIMLLMVGSISLEFNLLKQSIRIKKGEM